MRPLGYCSRPYIPVIPPGRSSLPAQALQLVLFPATDPAGASPRSKAARVGWWPGVDKQSSSSHEASPPGLAREFSGGSQEYTKAAVHKMPPRSKSVTRPVRPRRPGCASRSSPPPLCGARGEPLGRPGGPRGGAGRA